MSMMTAGFASASAVGSVRSTKTAPSSSPQISMLTVPGSMPTTRGIASKDESQAARDLGDRFRVEDEIVALEEARDARLVNFHLQSADAERAEGGDAVAVGAVVGDLDPFDAERRHGVDVGNRAETGSSGPRIAR